MEFCYLHWEGYCFQQVLKKNEPYGSKVVLQLMAPLLHQGYRVIMNNWFQAQNCSISCANRLDAMGTLHQNRNGVPAETECKTEKGRIHLCLQRQANDNEMERQKDVCLISTTHDDKMVPTRVRGQGMESPR
jgi:hypothetical protein